jgi:hypothetical protein
MATGNLTNSKRSSFTKYGAKWLVMVLPRCSFFELYCTTSYVFLTTGWTYVRPVLMDSIISIHSISSKSWLSDDISGSLPVVSRSQLRFEKMAQLHAVNPTMYSLRRVKLTFQNFQICLLITSLAMHFQHIFSTSTHRAASKTVLRVQSAMINQ